MTMNDLRRPDTEDGFSLVELLVVVGIMGILAAIAVPIYLNQQKEAYVTTLKSDITATAGQLSIYVKANEKLPTAAIFDTKVKVVTGPTTGTTNKNTITMVDISSAANPNGACIQGVRVFGTATDTKVWNYNLVTKKMTEGVCQAGRTLEPEVAS